MSLVRWNPLRDFDSFFTPTNRFFSTPEMKNVETSWKPLVDVTEDASEYLIKAELPEVKKEDIHVTSNNGYLTISGERKFEKEDKKLHTMERFYGSFERSFNLPDDVREEDINAEFKDGLLTLHLRKTEVPQASQTRIDIK
ncbi:Hsp20/alpha crystallin family protein [Aliikangiella marina]|uniref:Hsp20/alpha crystallin family protein n=1 Tax=Aliikangiella marina TaxID=1712262 RepID=A0A545THK3_9GAMM|nr:Hsp20/alpha crystallin family protein [Aliikangiella marina]TQV76709.1 Hsp20/alpha crystallin family protein [Aliikangiella marina]